MTSPFERAHAAWEAMASLRRARNLLKDFTYGDQWSWPVTDASGRVMTEGDAVRSLGKTPLTNNLLRSLVKSVVGRFRYNLALERKRVRPRPPITGSTNSMRALLKNFSYQAAPYSA
ncbi:MAG: hypothetical protein HDS81_07440 [Bacteroidales bacterium]|nr:hypothetical protein [Bacteroidales bacterium]